MTNPPVVHVRRLGVTVAAGLVISASVAACTTFWPTYSNSSKISAADTYTCARKRSEALGFKIATWNDRSRTFDARRLNEDLSDKLPGEQKQFDVLSVRVQGGKHDGDVTLNVRAKTVNQNVTRRGWTDEDEPASSTSQQAAKTVLESCSAPSQSSN